MPLLRDILPLHTREDSRLNLNPRKMINEVRLRGRWGAGVGGGWGGFLDLGFGMAIGVTTLLLRFTFVLVLD
jgi:hypothetical protein